jgi:diacylglycerol kinase
MKFIKSFKYAFNGIMQCCFTERNFKTQIILAAIAMLFGFYFNLTRNEWIIILMCSSIVLSMELINTAIEKLSDHVCPTINPEIKMVKDMAAGAVLISSVLSFIAGAIIFLPKFYLLYKSY